MPSTATLHLNIVSNSALTAEERLRRLEGASEDAEGAAGSLRKSFLGLTAAATGLAAASVALVRTYAAEEKEMRNLARIANAGVRDFQNFAFATDKIGISAEQLADISKDAQEKLGEFIAVGGGGFADFFDEIAPKVGLAAEELQGLSGPDVLIRVKKALDDTNTSLDQQIFYLESIASDSSLLAPLLANNGEQFRIQAQEARRLGVSLSEIESENLVKAAKASAAFDKAFSGAAKRIVAQLAPSVTKSTDIATNAVARFIAAMDSGEISARVDAIALQFDGMGADISRTLDLITASWNQFLGSSEGQGIAGATTETISFISDAFRLMPVNLRAAVSLMAVEFAAFVDYGGEYAAAFAKNFGVQIAALVDRVGIYGKEIADRLNPFDGDTFDFDAAIARSAQISSELTDSYFQQAEQQANIARQARLESISAILQERDASIRVFDEAIGKAESLADAYQKASAAGSGIGLPAGGETQQRPAGRPEYQEGLDTDFDSLLDLLSTEEDLISESYKRRLDLILKNTKEGSEKQNELKRRLDEQYASEVLDSPFYESPETFETQLQQVRDYYDRRLELARENGTNLAEIETQLAKQRNEALAAIEAERNSAIYSNASSIFGSLADLSKNFAGEQSNTYRAMFAASKAFAVADAIVKIQQGIAAASSQPWPTNLAAISSTVAATAGVVSTIKGQNFSGAYDNGGYIPRGSYGLVGEVGPEFVSGPANVTSRKDTRELIEKAASNDAPTVVEPKITVVNVYDKSVVGDYLKTSEGEQVVMNMLKKNGVVK